MDEQKKDGATMPEVTATEETVVPASAAESENATVSSDMQTEQKGGKHTLIIGAIVVVAALLLGYFFMQGDTDSSPAENGVEGAIIPDDSEVVATVNGTEITGRDLRYQMIQVAQAAGITDLATLDAETTSLLRSQSVDAIVNTEILVQTATDMGIAITDEEVNAEYESIVASIGGQEVADERLAILGTTEEEFKENLESDLIIQKYLETQTDSSVLEVSAEEIQAFYDSIAAQQPGAVPPLEDVSFQIEEQLKFQKEQEELSSMLEELRADADVEIHI